MTVGLNAQSADAQAVSALLFANYERVVDPNVIPVMRSLLEHVETLKEFDAVFVKRVCKVGIHLLKKHPDAIDGLEGRLLQFHWEGIARAEADGMPPLWRAHLAGHAADLVLYMNVPNPAESSLKEAFACYMLSAELSQDDEQDYAVEIARSAMKVAKRALTWRKESASWLRRRFAACMLYGDLAKSPRDSSEAYVDAAREAETLYITWGQRLWGRAWRDTKLEAAYRRVTDPAGAAIIFADASRVAYEVYAATGSQADRALAIILCHETATLRGLHPDFYVQNEERRARLLSR